MLKYKIKQSATPVATVCNTTQTVSVFCVWGNVVYCRTVKELCFKFIYTSFFCSLSSHIFFKIQFPLSSLLSISSFPKSWQSQSFQAELKKKVRTQWEDSNSRWEDSFQSMFFSVLSCVKDTWHACTCASAIQGQRDLSADLSDPKPTEKNLLTWYPWKKNIEAV